MLHRSRSSNLRSRSVISFYSIVFRTWPSRQGRQRSVLICIKRLFSASTGGWTSFDARSRTIIQRSYLNPCVRQTMSVNMQSLKARQSFTATGPNRDLQRYTCIHMGLCGCLLERPCCSSSKSTQRNTELQCHRGWVSTLSFTAEVIRLPFLVLREPQTTPIATAQMIGGRSWI